MKKSYNSEQIKAINHMDSNCLVLAGPGSGKTTLIIAKIIKLMKIIREPYSILALTYTDKAASDMQQRLKKTGYYYKQRVTVSTFHSFCNSILKRYINYLQIGITRNFEICDQDKIISSIAKHVNNYAFTKYVSDKKNLGLLPDENIGYDTNTYEKLYLSYQRTLTYRNLVDYDDLILYTHLLFKQDPIIKRIYQNSYKFIIIDEFQDTNQLQYELIKNLVHGTENKLFCVADDDQLIYTWRGASTETIKSFINDFSSTIITLSINYRCPIEVVAVANKLISVNDNRMYKQVESVCHEEKNCINVTRLSNRDEELTYIVNIIKKKAEQGCKYGDIAVFARRNLELNEIINCCDNLEIPYYCSKDDVYVEEPETRLLTCALKIMYNPNSRETYEEFEELLGYDEFFSDEKEEKRFLNDLKIKLESIRKIRETEQNLTEKIKFVTSILQLKEYMKKEIDSESQRVTRRENLAKFYRYVIELATKLSLQELIEKIDHSNAVHLMTVHAAKGLEYDNVIVTGLRYGNFPLNRAISEGNISEERRLFYVAITRTKKELFLTYSCEEKDRSIFLNEIEIY